MSATEMDTSPDNTTQTTMEAEALAWAARKEASIKEEAMAYIARENAVLEEKAAAWMASEKATLHQQALEWRASAEAELKSTLEARLAKVKQHANAEHERIVAEEKRKTAQAQQTSQALSGEVGVLKEQEKKLRAEISSHEEAAQSQQQGAAKQTTQVQDLRSKLVVRDSELEVMTSTNGQLEQKVASLSTAVMRGLVQGCQKDVEIASLKQDKETIILQAQSAIADKDARINDLQSQMAAQSQREAKTDAENQSLNRIAKDYASQKNKMQIESSKMETELEKARSENKQLLAKMKQATRELSKGKKKDGAGVQAVDIARSMTAMALGPKSGNGITKSNRRRPAPTLPRRRGQAKDPNGTDSASQSMEESDG